MLLARLPRWRVTAATALLVGVAVVAAGLGLPAAGATTPTPHRAVISAPGSLVLIGGSLSENRQIVREVIALAGGKGRARIGIITAASPPPTDASEAANDSLENSVTDGRYYARLFTRFGAAATYRVPLDTSQSQQWPGDTYGADRVDDPKVLSRVDRMTGFFFGGGDQLRYVDVLQDCSTGSCADQPVLAAVRARLAGGAVVAGSSAGNTIMQASPMVVRGESWTAWANGVKDDDAAFTPGAVVRNEGGFGFFDAGLLDSHVGERGRQGRLVRIAMYGDKDYAFGVDETTALVVRRLGTDRERFSVLGEGGVHILDLGQATFGGARQAVRDVRWSWLRSGDGYVPSRRVVVRRDGRQAVTRPRKAPDLRVGDIWSVRRSASGRMSELGVDLARSGRKVATGVTLQRSPRYEVTLTYDGLSRSWQSRKGEPHRAFSDIKLTIDRL